MKWRVRMCLFFSILISILLFIHYPIPFLPPSSSSSVLPPINYFKGNDSLVSFIQIHESLLLQFSFDDHRRGNLGPRTLRIVFVTKRYRPKLVCVFEDQKEAEGIWYEFSENHGKEYGIYVLGCVVPVNTEYLKTFQITVPNREWMSKELSVNYVIPEKEPKEFRMEYAICSPLIFGAKYTKEHLIEFVEMNRILGAERISFYVDYSSVRKELIEAIRFYQMEGIIDAISFHEPVKKIWYHGQLALIMDCLVRHSTSTRFVAFHDLDEFIVDPKGERTVDILPNFLNENKISIRVPTQMMSIKNETRPKVISNTLADGVADNTFTKCIVRPFHVFEQGIHHTSRTIFDTNKLEKAEFSELRVLHFKHAHEYDQEDLSLSKYFGPQMREEYFTAIRKIESL